MMPSIAPENLEWLISEWTDLWGRTLTSIHGNAFLSHSYIPAECWKSPWTVPLGSKSVPSCPHELMQILPFGFVSEDSRETIRRIPSNLKSISTDSHFWLEETDNHTHPPTGSRLSWAYKSYFFFLSCKKFWLEIWAHETILAAVWLMNPCLNMTGKYFRNAKWYISSIQPTEKCKISVHFFKSFWSSVVDPEWGCTIPNLLGSFVSFVVPPSW